MPVCCGDFHIVNLTRQGYYPAPRQTSVRLFKDDNGRLRCRSLLGVPAVICGKPLGCYLPGLGSKSGNPYGICRMYSDTRTGLLRVLRVSSFNHHSIKNSYPHSFIYHLCYIDCILRQSLNETQIIFFPMARQPLGGPRPPHFSRLHDHTFLDTPHSVGLLWTSNQLVAETSTWQHTALTRDRHPCSRWDSNPQS
jgi:hypothetical protein